MLRTKKNEYIFCKCVKCMNVDRMSGFILLE